MDDENETFKNKFNNIELEKKGKGFVGPKLPRLMTEAESKDFIERMLKKLKIDD